LPICSLFYSWDRAFLEEATLTSAVVSDKTERSGSSNGSSTYRISYRWVIEDGHEVRGRPVDESWSGSDVWSGGKESWEALQPGVSTVEIAWRYSDDRRSTKSRVVTDGAIGVPWPPVFLGIILLGVATGRIIWRRRRPGDTQGA